MALKKIARTTSLFGTQVRDVGKPRGGQLTAVEKAMNVGLKEKTYGKTASFLSASARARIKKGRV